MRKLMFAISVAVLAACNANPPPDADAPAVEQAMDQAPAPMPRAEVDGATGAPPAEAGQPAFVDRVWRALNDSAVEAGTTYVFHNDGTLIVDSPNAVATSGSWDYRDQ